MPALRFHALGVPVELRLSFVLLVVVVGLPTHLSPDLMLAWVVIATVGVLVHEFGHAGAFVWFGDRPRITLHGAGGHTTGAHPGVQRMVVVSAAGPAVGLIAGLWLALLSPSMPADAVTRQLMADALFVTIGLSLLNLVPLGTFDGNAILLGLVAAATGRPPGVAGWMLGALTIIMLVTGAVWIGQIDAAVTLVIITALQWRSFAGLLGRPEGRGSAAAMLGAGRPAEALACADADLQRVPTDIGTHLVRAGALAAMTRYAEAEAAYGAILELAPGTLPAQAGRSAARRALGMQESADADLDIVLAGPPRDIHEVGAQFWALYHVHRYEQAHDLIRSELAELGTRSPAAVHLRMLEALIESVTGRAEDALRHAAGLLSLRPDEPAIHEIAALASIQLGLVDQALRHAHRAVAGAPRHPELLETLGIVERLSGHPDRGYEALLEAAIARPELPRARAELSTCFTQLGRQAEASAALAGLPSWAADDPFVLYARGCILAASGEHQEAKERIARSSGIRPCLGSIARVDPVLTRLFEEEGAVIRGGPDARRLEAIRRPDDAQAADHAIAADTLALATPRS